MVKGILLGIFQRKSHLEEKNYGIIKIFRRFA